MPTSAATPSAVPGLARAKGVLLCQAGGAVCGLPLEHVIETLRPLRVEPVLGMPPFMAGLSVIRGAPVPVVVLARLLGQDQRASATRLVILRVGERRVALLVELVFGVRSLTNELSELPPLLANAQLDFVSALGALDSRLLLVLSSMSVVSDVTWAALPAAGDHA